VDVNDFLTFKFRRISFGMRTLLLGSRNKHYLCIGWCLFGADMILNLMYSHEFSECFWLWLIGLMLTSITLALAMICFQSFFAMFVRVFACDLLSMNE
jgi:hypothetical protein